MAVTLLLYAATLKPHLSAVPAPLLRLRYDLCRAACGILADQGFPRRKKGVEVGDVIRLQGRRRLPLLIRRSWRVDNSYQVLGLKGRGFPFCFFVFCSSIPIIPTRTHRYHWICQLWIDIKNEKHDSQDILVTRSFFICLFVAVAAAPLVAICLNSSRWEFGKSHHLTHVSHSPPSFSLSLRFPLLALF